MWSEIDWRFHKAFLSTLNAQTAMYSALYIYSIPNSNAEITTDSPKRFWYNSALDLNLGTSAGYK